MWPVWTVGLFHFSQCWNEKSRMQAVVVVILRVFEDTHDKHLPLRNGQTTNGCNGRLNFFGFPWLRLLVYFARLTTKTPLLFKRFLRLNYQAAKLSYLQLPLNDWALESLHWNYKGNNDVPTPWLPEKMFIWLAVEDESLGGPSNMFLGGQWWISCHLCPFPGSYDLAHCSRKNCLKWSQTGNSLVANWKFCHFSGHHFP